MSLRETHSQSLTSDVADDLSRLIRLLQVLHLLLCEGDIETAFEQASISNEAVVRAWQEQKFTENVLEVSKLRRADDRSSHARLREHPSKRNLRHADALLLRQLIDPAYPIVSGFL